MSSEDAQRARKMFEVANAIEQVSGTDAVFKYDKPQQQEILNSKPWSKDNHYFKHVRMSALALLKMTMHARSGGTIEVMGLMLGKIDGDSMVVIDAFALPVEGTETRVSAQAEGYEYMSEYMRDVEKVGRFENVIGWYHSHPGYGCWLSGIDVGTQMQNQKYQEPFLAVVIDPTRTMSAGKVEIGAFRTFPEGYKPPDEGPSEYQTIPLSKIEDFGVHCKAYYALEMSFFKSSLDEKLLELLWNKYWINTLSSSALLNNRQYTTNQIVDLSDKLERAEAQITSSNRAGAFFIPEKKSGPSQQSQLSKVTTDSSKLALENLRGLMSHVLREAIFNHRAPATQQQQQ